MPKHPTLPTCPILSPPDGALSAGGRCELLRFEPVIIRSQNERFRIRKGLGGLRRCHDELRAHRRGKDRASGRRPAQTAPTRRARNALSLYQAAPAGIPRQHLLAAKVIKTQTNIDFFEPSASLLTAH